VAFVLDRGEYSASRYGHQNPKEKIEGCIYVAKVKGKAIPLNASTSPEGSRRFKIPDFKTKVVSPTHRPPLLPRKYSWYLFLLEAEPTPGT